MKTLCSKTQMPLGIPTPMYVNEVLFTSFCKTFRYSLTSLPSCTRDFHCSMIGYSYTTDVKLGTRYNKRIIITTQNREASLAL